MTEQGMRAMRIIGRVRVERARARWPRGLAGRGRWSARASALGAGLLGLLLVLAGCQADTGQWQSLNFPFPTSNMVIVSMTADPDVPQLIYAGTSDGQVLRLRIESLGAVTGAGLPAGAAVSALYADPQHAGRVLAGTSRGVYQTSDYGDSWHAFGAGLPADDGIDALAGLPAPGAGGASTLFAGSEAHGVYVSHDGGADWVAANAGLPANVNVYGLTGDGASGTVYAALVGHGVYASTDGGQSWAPRGGSALAQSDAFTVLVGSKSGGTGRAPLYAGTSEGVFTSEDGGQTWQLAGLGTTRVIALASDPTSATTLYAGTANGSNSTGTIYRSTDGGAHWSVLAPGLSHAVAAIVVLRDKQNHPVVFGASGLILRYPALGGASGGPLSTILTIVLFLFIAVVMYWLLRRSRRQLLGPVPSMRPQAGQPVTSSTGAAQAPGGAARPRTTATGQAIPRGDELAEPRDNPWLGAGGEGADGSAARHPELN